MLALRTVGQQLAASNLNGGVIAQNGPMQNVAKKKGHEMYAVPIVPLCFNFACNFAYSSRNETDQQIRNVTCQKMAGILRSGMDCKGGLVGQQILG